MKIWIKNISSRIKNSYRLIVRDDENLKEKLSVTLKPINVFIILSMLFLLIGTLTYLGLAFTPLKALIPGNQKGSSYQKQYNLMVRVDSLEGVIKGLQIKSNLLDEILKTDVDDDDIPLSQPKITNENDYKKNEETSKKIGFRELRTLNYQFVPPIEGVITDTFNSQRNHYGIDIAAKEKSIVRAVKGGTVVFNNWSPDFGHVIIIQHSDEFISIYKHNAAALKKKGNLVKMGEAISLVGNTGKLSFGSHLHFELWNNGVPVNPKKYIVF
jgi:murein DD-endopeptidase MepM/ murein hydrolase activator NlpD